MRPPDTRAGSPPIPPSALFLGIFLALLLETAFAALLPHLFASSRMGGAREVGLAIAVSYSLGYLLLPAVSEFLGARRRRQTILIAGTGMLVALCAVFFAIPHLPTLIWGGILVFGILRVTANIGLLAGIAEIDGEKRSVQGWNSALQRLGSLTGIVAITLFAFTEAWVGAVALLALVATILVVVIAVSRAKKRDSGRPGREDGRGHSAGERFSLSAYAAALTLFIRSGRIRASALLNATIMLTMLLGVSFTALALQQRGVLEGGQIAALVMALIVSRDLSAVATGALFARRAGALGERGSLLVITMLFAASYIVIALPGFHVGSAVVAGVLQGIGLALGIAMTNLLATTGGPALGALPGAQDRLIATQLLSPLFLLALPAGAGASIDLFGGTETFVILAVLVLAGGWLMIHWLRPSVSHASTTLTHTPGRVRLADSSSPSNVPYHS